MLNLLLGLIQYILEYFMEKPIPISVLEPKTDWQIILFVLPFVLQIFMALSFGSLIYDRRIVFGSLTLSNVQFVSDFINIVLIEIIVLINYSYSYEFTACACVILITYVVVAFYKKLFYMRNDDQVIHLLDRYYLRNFRGLMHIFFSICLLADYLGLIPSRLEQELPDYGYQLFNVCTGLYICCEGIIAPELRRPLLPMYNQCMRCFLMIVIGTLQIIMNINNGNNNSSMFCTDWNVLLTIGSVKLFGSILVRLIGRREAIKMAMIVLVLNEIIMYNGGASCLFAPFNEGIFSIFNYLGLYLLSIGIGRMLLKRTECGYVNLRLTVTMYSITLGLFTFNSLSQTYFGTSLKLVHMAFTTWIVFLGTFLTYLLLCIENMIKELYYLRIRTKRIFAPLLIKAVCYNTTPFLILSHLTAWLMYFLLEGSDLGKIIRTSILTVAMFIICAIMNFLFRSNTKFP